MHVIHKMVIKLHIFCRFRHDNFGMLLDELYRGKMKPHRKSKAQNYALNVRFEAGSLHVEGLVEACDINHHVIISVWPFMC